MASPNSGFAAGFSSWKKRTSSLLSLPMAEDEQSGPSDSTQPPATSAQEGAFQLPTSAASPSVRESVTRSFIPGSLRENISPLDSAEQARSVREDTAELASYVLSDKTTKRRASFLKNRTSSSHERELPPPAVDAPPQTDEYHCPNATAIEEVSEPSSPESSVEQVFDDNVDRPGVGTSLISDMIRRSPPQPFADNASAKHKGNNRRSYSPSETRRSMPSPGKNSSPRANGKPNTASENTPLLYGHHSNSSLDTVSDLAVIESQKSRPPSFFGRKALSVRQVGSHFAQIMNPRTWDRTIIWQRTVMDPVRCLPAVIVGLLLNILDALSYGMILFPLGNPVFSHLGPAGISIFYVSTIVSQLTFSTGSIFRGGVGSELIEVVPFFHSMAFKITSRIGENNPDAIIATTITSYAASAMFTGLIFWLIGRFRLGYIIGFIPRHILIGCIGGVGWFLLMTGFEVSGRLEEFKYDLNTARKLFAPQTVALWTIPLALAVLQFVLQNRITSKYFLPGYILAIPAMFYFFVGSIDQLQPDQLRQTGWIFKAPPADEPWWFFWKLYKFHLVRWDAVAENMGAMFALTFFSLLHVPINVPALAQSTGEDNADLNRELKLHGFSNFISGLVGSIQNYLCYANTVFFVKSGGNSRLAGYMLAFLTFCVLIIGPKIIGYIPVMMVGTLIFVLGFELLVEALWTPRRKLKWTEYLTIVAIVLTMGIYDFVAGIFLGMILAFLSVIVHSSRVSAIRATYTGDQVSSMVRRNPSQLRYLQEVGEQTYIVKLSGFLFFGTIVGVEGKIRALITDEAFARHPLKFVVIDLWHVTGIDYSAGEGFMTISRLLHKRGVELLISGKDASSKVGNDLRAVGLGNSDVEVAFMPDLNSALESCENEQLKTFYARQEAYRVARPGPSESLEVPSDQPSAPSLEVLSQSPRRSHLHQAASNVLDQNEMRRSTRWQSISEPLRLMLQIFHDVSDKNEDFWFRAKPYFSRRWYRANAEVFRRGEPADGFFLVEKGELRADYDTPQGQLAEPIVQGTTCGELPFFSETNRTADVTAVKDSVVWVMNTEQWRKLQQEEQDVSQELLRISLKLTTERMHAMTNYISAVGN